MLGNILKIEIVMFIFSGSYIIFDILLVVHVFAYWLDQGLFNGNMFSLTPRKKNEIKVLCFIRPKPFIPDSKEQPTPQRVET